MNEGLLILTIILMLQLLKRIYTIENTNIILYEVGRDMLLKSDGSPVLMEVLLFQL